MRGREWLLLAGLMMIGCDDGGDATPETGADAATDGMVSDAGSPDAALAPDADLPDADLPDADLPDADLPDADLPDADLPVPDMGPTCPPLDADGPDGQVNTTEGFVQGHRTGDVWAWQGIPFAAPPVDDLRFEPPAAPACRPDGVLDATEYGPKCPQADLAAGMIVGDEDCLTLNIWSPAADDGARPVLLFIHGGGNIVGSAAQLLPGGVSTYDGRHIAARGDAVVITIQYRLGMLGFAAFPDRATNLAARDQLAALRWVQANIGRFGGDPERVLVFGESAGAVNTCTLTASPLSEGLFQRALMQSGACGSTPRAAAEAATAEAADALGCAADDLDCLRAVDAATIVREASGAVGISAGERGFGNGGWGPVVDGEVLTEDPYVGIGATTIPFIIGSNADEMASQQINQVRVATAQQYTATLTAFFGARNAARIEAVYPVDDYPTPNDAFIKVATDAYFTFPTRTIARIAAGRDAPTWRFFFQRRAETAQGRLPAAHGRELLYVFGTYADIRGFRPTAGEAAVSERMIDAWVRFAATGDPAGEGVEAWPAYDAETEISRVFDDPAVEPTAGIRTAECDLWEAIATGR